MRNRVIEILQVRRAAVLIFLYSIIVAVSMYIAYDVRFDFAVPYEYQSERLRVLLFDIPIKLIALLLARQMGSMITFFGIPDLFRLLSALLISALILLLLRFVGLGFFSPPRGVLLIDFLVCVSALCSLRLAARLFRERILIGQKMGRRTLSNVVIIGAGDAGASLVSDLMSTPARGFRPVGFLDDDIRKHGKFIHGVRVEGLPEDFRLIPSVNGVRHAIIAMPSAQTKRIREIALLLGRAGVQVETVPALEDLASGRARVSRIRPVEIQDLLGRPAVDLDTESIRQLVRNRVVLVTGAGGSIGSELCRQLADLGPARLLMLDRAEGSVFYVEQELIQLGMGALIQPIVADITDIPRMNFVFEKFRPELVFHAAAHKHVFMMERQPAEAIANNSIGTRVLAEMAAQFGVAKFVLISTDKAINPTSLMGASKRLAEIHLQALHLAKGNSTQYIMVRFGNVLGSSGSVIPIFRKQIAEGGPVTVTHPEVTRYFMTIPEAAGLVLQASVLGTGGEIFVLDMGRPIKILELATQMIELSGFKAGEDIEIKITGLKPGEKLYEELQHRDERHVSTAHPRIMQFMPSNDARTASAKAIEDLEPVLNQLDGNEIKRRLKQIVPEYSAFID